MTIMSVAPAASTINRKLVRLFVIWWAVVAFHLLVLDRHEVWPHGASVIAVCAAPPVAPIVLTVWHKGGAAVYGWLVTVLAAIAWVLAVRQRDDPFHLFLARAAVSGYWLVLWFMIGVGV